MANKQCICPHCGRIAEIRRRSNGQKLRFLYCKNKCGGLGSAAAAAELEKIEVDHIGEVGTFPEGTNVPAPIVNDTPVEVIPPKTTDWTPEPGETPEALEGGTQDANADKAKPKENAPADNKNDESNSSGVFTLVVSVLSIFGLVGGGVYLNSKKKG